MAQATALEPVVWELERPFGSVAPRDQLSSIYASDVWANFSAFVIYYWGDIDYESPGLGILLNLEASIQNGYVEKAEIVCYDNCTDSSVLVLDSPYYATLANLTLAEHISQRNDTLKARTSFNGENLPKKVLLEVQSNWMLASLGNQSQQLEIQLSLTYYNGSTFKRVVQPFEFKFHKDDENSFDDAREMVLGESVRDVIGGFSQYEDPHDFFKVHLLEGQTINLTASSNPPIPFSVSLYLYAPNNMTNPAAATKAEEHLPLTLTYTADIEGWWFIEVRARGGFGIYLLMIDSLPKGG